MQMVMCDKCGKPIDHTHFYKLEDKKIIHVDCDNPTPTEIKFVIKKAGPTFDIQTSNQRQISQNKIYEKN